MQISSMISLVGWNFPLVIYNNTMASNSGTKGILFIHSQVGDQSPHKSTINSNIIC